MFVLMLARKATELIIAGVSVKGNRIGCNSNYAVSVPRTREDKPLICLFLSFNLTIYANVCRVLKRIEALQITSSNQSLIISDKILAVLVCYQLLGRA
jgi:hypothetical protein